MPLNGFLTNLLKLAVGRPRPSFLARCWPDGHIPDDAFGRPITDCTNPDKHVVRDASKSFPSGHSSFSFAVFVFIFLYLSGKMRTFSEENRYRISSGSLVINVALLLSEFTVGRWSIKLKLEVPHWRVAWESTGVRVLAWMT